MNWLETATILVTGFVGPAEFASVALVHPVIRKLAPDDQLTFEKGLLKTYGRIMPIGMTAATVLAIILAIATPSAWLIVAAVALAIALMWLRQSGEFCRSAASTVSPRGVCPINGVWGPAVFISGWFSRTVRRR